MALEEQVSKYRSLDAWFDTPQGQRVGSAFGSELATISSHLKGETLLQLGSCGNNSWLPGLRYRDKWLLMPYCDREKSSVLASLTNLPLARDSVDCIIAPLTMEAFSREKNPIDEIDRILKPMGYVILFGINPWSLWGFSLRWGSLDCFGNKLVNLSSSFSTKHAMLSRDYRQCYFSNFYYIPPITTEKWIRHLEFFNEVGKMVCPFPAGFYCLTMQKFQAIHPSVPMAIGKKIMFSPTVAMKI